MRTIKDKELHEKYCNICIDSPNSLFASLDESSKSIIRQTSICKMYRKGDLIYEEGNKPFGLICLITGKAKIAKKGIAGREQIVRMAKPVGFIGYRAFFAEEMHIASAEALEESIVCIMKTELIFGIVRSNSDVAMNVIRALATDLGFSNRRTVTLTQKHIRGRLAEALLVLKDTYGFEDDNMTLKICLSGRYGQSLEHDHLQCHPHAIQLCLGRHTGTFRQANQDHEHGSAGKSKRYGIIQSCN